MNRSIVTIAVICLFPAFAFAEDEVCTIADLAAPLPPQLAFDSEVAQTFCDGPDAPALAAHYFEILRLDLDAFWNPDNVCAPQSMTGRLVNAARFMDVMMQHRSQQGLPTFNWINHVQENTPTGFVAECGPPGVIARNPSGDGPIKLFPPFFWGYTSVQRASTLVHEAVHEWVPHIDDEACEAGKSCDTAFGQVNATSFQVDFLADAVSTYRFDPATGAPWVVDFGSGICSHLPLLPPSARQSAVGSARSKLDFNFTKGTSVFGPPGANYRVAVSPADQLEAYGGIVYLSDGIGKHRWACHSVCSAPPVCNASFQPGNGPINAANNALCFSLNLQGLGAAPATFYALQQQLIAETKPCIPGVDPAVVESTCNGLIGSSSSVADVEAGWPFPDMKPKFDSGAALAACERRFCEQRFDPSWTSPAEAACYEWDDPLGCAPRLCGPVTDYSSALCRKSYFETTGKLPADLIAPQGACEKTYQACTEGSHALEWAAARAAGLCSLYSTSPAFIPALLGEIQKQPSLQGLVAEFPGAKVDNCFVAYAACKAVDSVAADELKSDAGDIDPALGFDPVSPYPPLDLTSISNPSSLRALHGILGEERFFSLFGTEGLDHVFSPDELSYGRRVSSGPHVAARAHLARLAAGGQFDLLTEAQRFRLVRSLRSARTPQAIVRALDAAVANAIRRPPRTVGR